MRAGRALLAAAAIGAVAWLTWPAAPAPGGGSAASGAQKRRAAQSEAAWDWGAQAALLGRLPGAAPPAAESMAQARVGGDARSPPIAPETPRTDLPTAQQLADPKAYLALERARTLQLYAAYDRAAAAEIPKLRADIARGRAAGIAEEKIAKAEAKLRGLEAIRAKLLIDNPELAH